MRLILAAAALFVACVPAQGAQSIDEIKAEIQRLLNELPSDGQLGAAKPAGCPCPGDCPCPEGACPCPTHGAAADAGWWDVVMDVPTGFPCVNCDKSLPELARLRAAGYRVRTRKVPDDAHAGFPVFVLANGKTFTGYQTAAKLEEAISGYAIPPAARLAVAPTAPASPVVERIVSGPVVRETGRVIHPAPPVVMPQPRPVVTHAYQQHPQPMAARSIPPARRTWSFGGGNSGPALARHLAQTHGINAAGMSNADMVRAHSHAHEGTWGSVNRSGFTAPQVHHAMYQPIRYSQQAPTVMRSGGCPGGNCPGASRRGLFGGLFR